MVINGGEISGNTYTGTGVASVVYLFMTAKVEMNGGIIADNNLGTSSNSVVFNHSSNNTMVTVNGGTIKNNTVGSVDRFGYVFKGVEQFVIGSAAEVSGTVLGSGVNAVDVNTLKSA